MNWYSFTNDITNSLTYECQAAGEDEAWAKMNHTLEFVEGLGLRLPVGRWRIRSVKESTSG